MRDTRRTTALVLTTAEAAWWVADRLRHAADHLEHASGVIGNAGHELLEAWAQHADELADAPAGHDHAHEGQL